MKTTLCRRFFRFFGEVAGTPRFVAPGPSIKETDKLNTKSHRFVCLHILSYVGTYSDIGDQRYWTELDIGTSDIGLKRAESDIISDFGINFYPISDMHMFIDQCSG
jgi:hypothetical protein